MDLCKQISEKVNEPDKSRRIITTSMRRIKGKEERNEELDSKP
jgi:hypothetical protein